MHGLPAVRRQQRSAFAEVLDRIRAADLAIAHLEMNIAAPEEIDWPARNDWLASLMLAEPSVADNLRCPASAPPSCLTLRFATGRPFTPTAPEAAVILGRVKKLSAPLGTTIRVHETGREIYGLWGDEKDSAVGVKQ
jgi:hypothetical protein